MGNGGPNLDASKSGVITLEPITFTIDPKLTGRPELPMEGPQAPSPDLLKNLTAAVKSLGVDIASSLDEKGNLKPDQTEAAKKRVAGQLEEHKKKISIPTEDKKALLAALPFLKDHTEFVLLSKEDQAKILQDAGYKNTDDILNALEKDYANPNKKVALFVSLKAREAEADKKPAYVSARLFDTAAALDPENRQLRLSAARAKLAWAESESDPESKKTLLEESKTHLHAVLKKNPDDLSALSQLKNTLGAAGSPEAAKSLAGEDLLKLLHKDGGDEKALKLRSEVLSVVGDEEAAKEMSVKADEQRFDGALEKLERMRDKNSPEAKEALAGLEKELGDWEKRAQEGKGQGKILDLNRLRRFHKLAGNTEKLGEVEKQIKESCDEMRAGLKLKPGESPSAQQVYDAKFLAGFSAHLQNDDDLVKDLETWKQLLNVMDPSTLPANTRLNHYCEIMKQWGTLRTRAETVANWKPGPEIMEAIRKGDPMGVLDQDEIDKLVESHRPKYPGGLKPMDIREKMNGVKTGLWTTAANSTIDTPDKMNLLTKLLERHIDGNDKDLEKYLTPKGLEEYVQENSKAELTKEFDEKNNPVANVFHKALHAQGIPDAVIDQNMRGEGAGTLDPSDVFGYIGTNFDDPRVQEALKAVEQATGMPIPKDLKEQVKEKGFGKAMADHFTNEAEQLRKNEAKAKNKPESDFTWYDAVDSAEGARDLLVTAAMFDPTNTDRHLKLADFYFDQQHNPNMRGARPASMKSLQAAIELERVKAKETGDNKKVTELENRMLAQWPDVLVLTGDYNKLIEKGKVSEAQALLQDTANAMDIIAETLPNKMGGKNLSNGFLGDQAAVNAKLGMLNDELAKAKEALKKNGKVDEGNLFETKIVNGESITIPAPRFYQEAVLAKVNEALGKPTEPAGNMKEGIKLDKEQAAALRTPSESLDFSRNAKEYHRKAVKKFQEAIDNDPNSPKGIGFYQYKAKSQHALGDYAGARSSLITASNMTLHLMTEKAGEFLSKDVNYKAKVMDERRHSRVMINDHACFILQDQGALDNFGEVKFFVQDAFNPNIQGDFLKSYLGNYVLSDAQDIKGIDPYRDIPAWADAGLREYDQQLKAELEDKRKARSEAETNYDFRGMSENIDAEIKLLKVLGKDDEAKALGEKAETYRTQLSVADKKVEVEGLVAGGKVDAEALFLFPFQKDETGLGGKNLVDYVSLVEEKGPKGEVKTKLVFQDKFYDLNPKQQEQVLEGIIKSGPRMAIVKDFRAAEGPAKVFYESQIALYDGNLTKAGEKIAEFKQQVAGSKDPKILALLDKAGKAEALIKQGTAKPPDEMMEDVKGLLGTMLPPQYHDARGRLDPKKFDPKSFESFDKFREFIATQASVDGKAFNQVLFANYHSIVRDPKFEPILRRLYAEANPEKAGEIPKISDKEFQALYHQFNKEIANVDFARFAANNIGTAEGRNKLRRMLDPNHPDSQFYDKGFKADLLEEIIDAADARTRVPARLRGRFEKELMTDMVDIRITDENVRKATDVVLEILDIQDRNDITHSKHHEKYLKHPQEITVLTGGGLDKEITPARLKEVAQLYNDLQGKTDGRSQLQAKLANMWLLVADNSNWTFEKTKKPVDSFARGYMINQLDQFMKEAKDIRTDAQMVEFNKKLNLFLKGPVKRGAVEYEGDKALNAVKEFTADNFNFTVGENVHDLFEGLGSDIQGQFTDLYRFSDEIWATDNMGDSVNVMDPELKIQDPEMKEQVTDLIQGLRSMKRGFWASYKGDGWFYKLNEKRSSLLGMDNDIDSIKDANRRIDQIIDKLQNARTPEEVRKYVRELDADFSEGGALHKARVATDASGWKVTSDIVQVAVEILLTEVATAGAATALNVAKAGIAMGRYAIAARSLSAGLRFYEATSNMGKAARLAGLAEEVGQLGHLKDAISFARRARNAADLGKVADGVVELENAAAKAAQLGDLAQSKRLYSAARELEQIGLKTEMILDGSVKGVKGAKATLQAVKEGDTAAKSRIFASRAVNGFKTGFKMTITSNVMGLATGQLKGEPYELEDMIKSATATGISMFATGPFEGGKILSQEAKGASKLLKDPAITKKLYQDYLARAASGLKTSVKGVGTKIKEFPFDMFKEVSEEVIDNYVKKFLDGKPAKLTQEEFESIMFACAAGQGQAESLAIAAKAKSWVAPAKKSKSNTKVDTKVEGSGAKGKVETHEGPAQRDSKPVKVEVKGPKDPGKVEGPPSPADRANRPSSKKWMSQDTFQVPPNPAYDANSFDPFVRNQVLKVIVDENGTVRFERARLNHTQEGQGPVVEDKDFISGKPEMGSKDVRSFFIGARAVIEAKKKKAIAEGNPVPELTGDAKEKLNGEFKSGVAIQARYNSEGQIEFHKVTIENGQVKAEPADVNAFEAYVDFAARSFVKQKDQFTQNRLQQARRDVLVPVKEAVQKNGRDYGELVSSVDEIVQQVMNLSDRSEAEAIKIGLMMADGVVDAYGLKDNAEVRNKLYALVRETAKGAKTGFMEPPARAEVAYDEPIPLVKKKGTDEPIPLVKKKPQEEPLPAAARKGDSFQPKKKPTDAKAGTVVSPDGAPPITPRALLMQKQQGKAFDLVQDMSGQMKDPAQRPALVVAASDLIKEAADKAEKGGVGFRAELGRKAETLANEYFTDPKDKEAFRKEMAANILETIRAVEKQKAEEATPAAARKGGVFAPKKLPSDPNLPPPMEDGTPSVKIPKAPGLPKTNLIREGQIEVGLFEKLYPPEKGTEGRDRYVGAFLVQEVNTMGAVFSETGNPELGAKVQADLKTLREAQEGSEAYNQAMDRLGKILSLRRHGTEFASRPVELMGEGSLNSFSKKVAEIYSLEAKPVKIQEAPVSKGSIAIDSHDEWADFDDSLAPKKITIPPPVEVDEGPSSFRVEENVMDSSKLAESMKPEAQEKARYALRGLLKVIDRLGIDDPEHSFYREFAPEFLRSLLKDDPQLAESAPRIKDRVHVLNEVAPFMKGLSAEKQKEILSGVLEGKIQGLHDPILRDVMVGRLNQASTSVEGKSGQVGEALKLIEKIKKNETTLKSLNEMKQGDSEAATTLKDTLSVDQKRLRFLLNNLKPVLVTETALPVEKRGDLKLRAEALRDSDFNQFEEPQSKRARALDEEMLRGTPTTKAAAEDVHRAGMELQGLLKSIDELEGQVQRGEIKPEEAKGKLNTYYGLLEANVNAVEGWKGAAQKYKELRGTMQGFEHFYSQQYIYQVKGSKSEIPVSFDMPPLQRGDKPNLPYEGIYDSSGPNAANQVLFEVKNAGDQKTMVESIVQDTKKRFPDYQVSAEGNLVKIETSKGTFFARVDIAPEGKKPEVKADAGGDKATLKPPSGNDKPTLAPPKGGDKATVKPGKGSDEITVPKHPKTGFEKVLENPLLAAMGLGFGFLGAPGGDPAQAAPGQSGTVEIKPENPWIKGDDFATSLSPLAQGKRVVVSEKGEAFTAGHKEDVKGILSLQRGSKSYRLDALPGLEKGEVVITGKDGKGGDRTVSLKPPLGVALPPGEYKVVVNGKEMKLNLPPISEPGSKVTPLPSAAPQGPAADLMVEKGGKTEFLGVEVSPQFEQGLRLFMGKENPEPFVDFNVEGAKVLLKERNFGRAEKNEALEGFAVDNDGQVGFKHAVDRHAHGSEKAGAKPAGEYAENVDIEMMGRETVKSFDRVSQSYDDQGRVIFILQKDFKQPVGKTTKGTETKTNQVILSYDGKIISTFPVEPANKGWVSRSELGPNGKDFGKLFLEKGASAEVAKRHGPFLPGSPDAQKGNLYLENTPYGVVNQRTVAFFLEKSKNSNAEAPGTHQEEITVMKKGKPVKVMATVAEMRFEQPIGVREGPNGEKVPLYVNRTYYIEETNSKGQVNRTILGGYPIGEFGEKGVAENIWNPALRSPSAVEVPKAVGDKGNRGPNAPAQNKRGVAAFKGPQSGEALVGDAKEGKGRSLKIAKLDVSSKGTLANVELPAPPAQISFQGKEWKAKEEFHVTLLGFAQSKEIAAKIKQEKNLSNKQVDAILKEANEYAAQGLNLEISLGKVYRIVEHEGNRSIIVDCDVKGSEAYYKRLAEFLKEKHGIDVSLEKPPFHVTLFTGENGKAIGIPTEKDMQERSRPLTLEETNQLKGLLGREKSPTIDPASLKAPEVNSRFESHESRKALAKAIVEAEEAGLGSVDAAGVKAAKAYLAHGDNPPADADLSFVKASNDYSYTLGRGKWGVLAFLPEGKSLEHRIGAQAWTVESVKGDEITLKGENGEVTTVKGIGKNAMAHPFKEGDRVDLIPRIAGGSGGGPTDSKGGGAPAPTHIVKPRMTDTSVDLEGQVAPSDKKPTLDRKGTEWVVRQQNGDYNGEISVYRDGQLVGRLGKDDNGKSFPLKHGDQVVAGSKSFIFSNPYESTPVELPAKPAQVIPITPQVPPMAMEAAALKKTAQGWELRPPKDVTVVDGKTGEPKSPQNGVILLKNGDVVKQGGENSFERVFNDGRFEPKMEKPPVAAAAFKGPESGEVKDKTHPVPSEVLGSKTMGALRNIVVKEFKINAEDVHEVSVDYSNLTQAVKSIADKVPEGERPKTICVIANLRKPDGNHVIMTITHEVEKGATDFKMKPHPALFEVNYKVYEPSPGKERVEMGLIKAREDIRPAVVSPSVEGMLKFSQENYPGSTVETKAINLISAQLAGANLDKARFIEIKDSKTYKLNKTIDLEFLGHLEKTGVLSKEQAATLKSKIEAAPLSDSQKVEIHNQFIQFVRENYSKNPDGASNEVSYVFQKLRKSKEALQMIRANPYRGDLWVEGEVREKKAEVVPLKPKGDESLPVAAAKGDESAVAEKKELHFEIQNQDGTWSSLTKEDLPFQLRQGPRGSFHLTVSGESLTVKDSEGAVRELGKGQSHKLPPGEVEVTVGNKNYRLKVP